jgi:hypothetical protein
LGRYPAAYHIARGVAVAVAVYVSAVPVPAVDDAVPVSPDPWQPSPFPFGQHRGKYLSWTRGLQQSAPPVADVAVGDELQPR